MTQTPSDPGMPPRPPASTVTARPGVLTRWKNAEPVRLYLYGLALIVVAGLQLAGVLAGDWPDYAAMAVAVLLGVIPAAEAVRASVYAPTSTLAAVMEAAGARSAAASAAKVPSWEPVQ